MALYSAPANATRSDAATCPTAYDTFAAPRTTSQCRYRWSLYGIVPWFLADGTARRGIFWASASSANHCMRTQPILGAHDVASSAGASRICLDLSVWRRACHTQEETMQQWVRRGLWWGDCSVS